MNLKTTLGILVIVLQIFSGILLSYSFESKPLHELTGGPTIRFSGGYSPYEIMVPVYNENYFNWGIAFLILSGILQIVLHFLDNIKQIWGNFVRNRKKPKLSLIAGISQNNCIGLNGQLPWHIPEDLKHFREVTAGKTVLMGRKTWESLPEKFRPLPNRTNIIITRQIDYPVPAGVEVYATIDEAVTAHPNEEIIVIGGAEIYKQTIDRADRLYITHINQIVVGDAFFPEIDLNVWKETEREDHNGFSFVTYVK